MRLATRGTFRAGRDGKGDGRVIFARLGAVAAFCLGLVLSTGSVIAQSDWSLPATETYDAEATLRVGHGGPAVSFDPHRYTTTGDQTYTFLVFDRLTRLDRDGLPEGMLASSWEFAADGSYLDLILRDDVTFHDGTKFDAEAVKANIERAKTIDRSSAAPLLEPIDSVEAIEPYRARLHLVAGQGGTLATILATAAGSMISPKAIAENKDLSLDPGDAGSGPYIVTSFKPNEFASYERADEIWDKGAGLAKVIEHTFYPTNSARLRALQSGVLDFGQMLGAEVGPAQKMVESGQYIAYANYGTVQALYLRASKPQFKDIRVRQAIFMAIDRPAIAEAVFHGTCIAAVQPAKEDMWWSPPGYTDFAYDPAAAKALLAEAGASDLAFEIVVPSGSQYEQESLIIQSQLAEIGVTVTVSPMGTADAIAAFRENRADALFYNVSAQAHPEITVKQYYTGGYKATPEEDLADTEAALAKAVSPSLTQEEQAKAFQDLTKRLSEQASVFPVCWGSQLWTAQPYVLNLNSVPKVGTARDFRFLGVKPH